MRNTSIAVHDPIVVEHHTVPCRDGRTGRVGNCPQCSGAGFLRSKQETASPGDGYSCCSCAGKGWVGRCGTCRGLTILSESDGYELCPACAGHGHDHAEFYTSDRVHAMFVVRVNTGQFVTPLGEAPIAFGASQVYADVRLFDQRISKRHFETRWSPESGTHEVIDTGRYSLALNGTLLAGVPDRVRVYADGQWTGDRRKLSAGDVIAIGQYLIEYRRL